MDLSETNNFTQTFANNKKNLCLNMGSIHSMVKLEGRKEQLDSKARLFKIMSGSIHSLLENLQVRLKSNKTDKQTDRQTDRQTLPLLVCTCNMHNNFKISELIYVSASIHSFNPNSFTPVINLDDNMEILDEETGIWSGLTGMVGFSFSHIFSRHTFCNLIDPKQSSATCSWRFAMY